MTLQTFGGRRYATAIAIDALGAGLLRPFLILYAVQIARLDLRSAGAALSIGLLAGLLALPLAGRWLDRGARSSVVAATLFIRTAGLLVLLLVPGAVGFAAAALLLGIGTQVWPAAHAAVVTSLAQGRERDRVLAATRSLRNAGLGIGALLATVAVAGGTGALRWLAGGTAVGCLLAAGLVLGVRVTRHDQPTGAPAGSGPAGSRPAGSGPGQSGILTALLVINLPYSLCFDVLEVALPILLVTQLEVGPAWSSAVFVLNTILVIATQVLLVVRLSHRPRAQVLAGSGIVLATSYLGFLFAGLLGGEPGAVAVVVVSVLYTVGEVLYAGSGTALVADLAPPQLVGRALARWQLSSGLGRAAAPLVLSGLLSINPALLWLVLAVLTAGAALSAVGLQRGDPAGRDADQAQAAGGHSQGHRLDVHDLALGPDRDHALHQTEHQVGEFVGRAVQGGQVADQGGVGGAQLGPFSPEVREALTPHLGQQVERAQVPAAAAEHPGVEGGQREQPGVGCCRVGLQRSGEGE